MVAANPYVSGDSVAIFGLVPRKFSLVCHCCICSLPQRVESQHGYMGRVDYHMAAQDQNEISELNTLTII